MARRTDATRAAVGDRATLPALMPPDSLPPAASGLAVPAGEPAACSPLMPGYRLRHDGWTAARTQRFLDTLAHTGCVRDACRVADVSNTAGYRLRARFPAFAAAWEAALARSRVGLEAVAFRRAVEGKETIIYRNGAEVERRVSPSDSMLALLIKRGDLAGDPALARADGKRLYHPDTVLTFAEWDAGWRFDNKGRKDGTRSLPRVQARLEARFAMMRQRMREDGRLPPEDAAGD